MTHPSDPYSQSPRSIGAPSGAYPPYPPQVVHVVAKPGGFWRAISFVFGLILFAGIFALGLGVGVFIMFAGASYDSVIVPHTYRNGGSSEIAIIPVEGVIDGPQAEFVHAAVDHVLKHDSIAAVVLRVDSPGGGVTSSDEIWNEIKRLKDHHIPVIASYGGLAASGGYYISCGADYIVAQETCITGSIGVIAQVMTFEGLLGKVGVQPVTLVASGSPQKSVANDLFRTWNDQDKAKIQMVLDSAYATFNKRVRDGRGSAIGDPEKVNAIANGSIYTAQQAKENGLIDAIGYLDDAIAMAETRGSVPTGRATVVELRQPPTLLSTVLGAESKTAGKRQANSFDADSIRGIVNDLSSVKLMYLMH